MNFENRQVKEAYINGYADSLRNVLDIISNKYPGLFGQEYDEVMNDIAMLMSKLDLKKIPCQYHKQSTKTSQSKTK